VARYRWTILALGTGAQTAYSAVFLGIPVLAPALQDTYDLDLTQLGLALAAANGGSVSARSSERESPDAGPVSSLRHTRRPLPCSCSR
jgi:hypothetical protein